MNIVTGSFGYIGRYITRELLERGQEVKTITTHPDKPNPFGERVQAASYHFEDRDKLTAYLTGAETLFNTYYVRFNYRKWSFAQAVQNTRVLFNCAKEAGVNKIVHISVTNPSLDDELPYYRGKAQQEEIARETGQDHAIIRPTLVFGKEDILVNNIAWTIRKFPVVPVFGSGDYRVQPIFVGDLAQIAVDLAQTPGSQVIDAAGPEVYTYEEFLRLIARELNRRVALMPTPPGLGIALGKLIGMFMGDVMLTRDELRGLMRNKLTSTEEPAGETLFSEWLGRNIEHLGQEYTSELERHFYWKEQASPLKIAGSKESK